MEQEGDLKVTELFMPIQLPLDFLDSLDAVRTLQITNLEVRIQFPNHSQGL